MVGRRCRAHPAASRRGVGDPAPHRRRRGPAAAYRPRPDARKASVHGGRDRRALPHPAPGCLCTGIPAGADRPADFGRAAGDGAQLHAHAQQLFGFSRRHGPSFRRLYRAAGRGVQRLSRPARRRAQHRVVLHAHSPRCLQPGGPAAPYRAEFSVQRRLHGHRPHPQAGRRGAAHRPAPEPRPERIGRPGAGPRPLYFQLLHARDVVCRYGLPAEARPFGRGDQLRAAQDGAADDRAFGDVHAGDRPAVRVAHPEYALRLSVADRRGARQGLFAVSDSAELLQPPAEAALAAPRARRGAFVLRVAPQLGDGGAQPPGAHHGHQRGHGTHLRAYDPDLISLRWRAR